MRIIFLLLIHFGISKCSRPLSPLENKKLQSICGTKPAHYGRFAEKSDNKRHLYGGDPIPGKMAPWAVDIDFNGNRCSGTLISSRHILTASHCVMNGPEDFNWALRYSERSCENNWFDLVFNIKHTYYTVYNSEMKVLTKNIVKLTLINMCGIPDLTYDDFMVLELGENVQFNDIVHPICVPKNQNFEDENNWVEISTFGHNRFSIEPNQDPPLLRQGGMQITYPLYEGRGFSATDYRKQVVLRQGDSGGTGYAKHPKNGRFYVIGVATTTGYPQYDSGFVSVGYHQEHLCRSTGIC